MLKSGILAFILMTSTAYAQMSEAEVSDMCMGQIVAGMVEDNVFGPESGICVKFNKDPNGNVTGMDFKLNTSAFELGKTDLNAKTAEEQRRRLQTIKDFVLNYQKIATKNYNLKVGDLDIEVRSYADGVAGPASNDAVIKSMRTWGDLLQYVGDDKDGVRYLGQIAPSATRPESAVNFDKLSERAQSAIRNIVLGKKRSLTICKELGINEEDCAKRKNSGFSSPELEQRPRGPRRECDERRVSVIKVNMTKAVEISGRKNGEFHPKFQIPDGPQGEELKGDMQTASFFDLIKRHKETVVKYRDPEVIKREREEALRRTNSAKTGAEKDFQMKRLQALNAFSPDNFSLLDLPPSLEKSSDYSFYLSQLTTVQTKLVAFKRKISTEFPALTKYVEAGDFIGFKEAVDSLPTKTQRDQVMAHQSDLALVGRENSTDVLNFFSAGEALQYSFIKNPNSPHLTNAATVVNQSNSQLNVALSNADLESARRPKEGPNARGSNNVDDGKAHWQCYGGCGTGIHESSDGTLTTTFRDQALSAKNANQVVSEFGDVPLGFGALKSLNVYVIKDCANCDCLRQKGARLDDILRSPKATRITMDKVTRSSNGKERSITKTAGTIEDPYKTCLFTPPVAHTCRVDPRGSNNGHPIQRPQTNYGCAMWDKSSHGLRWTANFVKEGLNLAENASEVSCQQKAASFKEIAQSAECKVSDPDPVPESCQ